MLRYIGTHHIEHALKYKVTLNLWQLQVRLNLPHPNQSSHISRSNAEQDDYTFYIIIIIIKNESKYWIK